MPVLKKRGRAVILHGLSWHINMFIAKKEIHVHE